MDGEDVRCTVRLPASLYPEVKVYADAHRQPLSGALAVLIARGLAVEKIVAERHERTLNDVGKLSDLALDELAEQIEEREGNR